MNEKTRQSALKALDGFRQIVRNGMVQHEGYVSEEVLNDDLAQSGALCQGRAFCLLGSLWRGAGVRLTFESYFTSGPTYPVLPGVEKEKRDAFLAHRPGLRAAYDALNAAADKRLATYSKHHQTVIRNAVSHLAGGYGASSAEVLFEGVYVAREEGKRVPALTDQDLLALADEAQATVEAA